MLLRPASICTIALLACTASAAPPPPLLTPDTPVDAPVMSAELGTQSLAALTYGGTYYFAVWEEQTAASNFVVRGARIDSSGAALDAPAIVIATSATEPNPAVAYDGTNYRVVWLSGTTTPQVSTATVDPVTLTVGTASTVTSSAGQKLKPVVAAGGGTALVCWEHSGGNIECTYYTGNTASSTVNNLQVSNVTGNAPSVTWGGASANNFLVLYDEQANSVSAKIRAALVDSTGVSGQQAVSTGSAASAFSAAVASHTSATDGSTYIAYWADFRAANAGFQIWQRPISFTGTLGTEAVIAQNANDDYLDPQAVYAGGTFFVAWDDKVYGGFFPVYGVFGGRYNAAGTGSDGPSGNGVSLSNAPPQIAQTLTLDGRSMRRAIATDGAGHILTAWTGTSTGGVITSVSDQDVFALATDPSSAPSAVSSKVVSQQPASQRNAASASNGTVALLVWEDDRNLASTGVDLYGLFYRLDGVPLGAGPFVICNQPRDQFQPAVAAIPGGDFLVAWADTRTQNGNGTGAVSLMATRVGADKTVRDGGGVTVMSGSFAKLTPTVAASGTGWLVAWEDWENSPDANTVASEVWGATVSAGGVVGGAGAISTNACAPAATFDGTRYFVAYETPCSRDPMPMQSDVAAHWVSTAGVAEGTVVPIASSTDSETAPAVASDGKQVFVAWRAQGTGGLESILGAPIADDAATLAKSPTQISSGTGPHLAPSVAFAVPATNAGVGLVTWIGSATQGVQAARVDDSFGLASDGVFTVQVGAMFQSTLDLATVVSFSANGNGQSHTARYTPRVALATAPTGETLVGFTPIVALSGLGTPRVHTRKLGIVGLGGVCNGMASGCGLGFCTGGHCCDAPCDGICQACGANGCIEVPPMESRCPAMPVSCKALSTECRVFTDPPANRCSSFGECASSADLTDCTMFTNAPDGTACSEGSCLTGECLAMSVPNDFRRQLPAAGCDAGGGGRTGLFGLLAVLLLAAVAWRRRLRALVLLLFIGGCSSNQVALDVNLQLADNILVRTHHARVILNTPMATLTQSSPTQVVPGLTVAKYDADGDGHVDIVLDMDQSYTFARTNRFRLVSDPIMATVPLAVKAEIYDGLGNCFARLGGPSRDPAVTSEQALLSVGEETHANDLAPICINDCADGTLHLNAADASQGVAFAGGQVTALAASGAILAAGAAHEALASGAPNAGLVTIYRGTTTQPLTDNGDLSIPGPDRGAQFGAALALGDVNGDGLADLVVGAPGFDSARGAVYVYYGSSGGLDTTMPAMIKGAAENDGLGASVLITGAAGGPAILAGADGASKVYAIKASDVAAGAMGDVSILSSVVGAAQSRFGASLAIDGTRVAIGAPTESGGAAYLVALGDFSAQGTSVTGKKAQSGTGGFGSQVAFARIGAGDKSLVVGAPGSNSVRVFAPDMAHAVLADASVSALGASLAVVSLGDGDAVVAGAPSTFASSPGAGAAYLMRPGTLQVAATLQLDANGTPSALSVAGGHSGDTVGAQVAVGDVDGDGRPDLVLGGTSHSLLVYKGPLP